MRPLFLLLIGLALAFLFILLEDPFGLSHFQAPPPRLEETGPSAEVPERVRPVAPEDIAPGPEEPESRLGGRVTNLVGEAVEGARVALYREAIPESPGNTLYDLVLRVTPPPEPFQTAVTDKRGEFEMPPPGPGTYEVVTEAKGYARDVLPGTELTEEAPGGHLDIVLEAGTELAGRVVDPDGRVVTGAVVMIRTEATATDPVMEVTTVTDGWGRYRFPSLPPGREWGILVRAEARVRTALTGVKLPQKSLDLILARGQDYRFKVLKAGLLEPLPARVLVRDGEVPLGAGETDAGGWFRFRAVPSTRITIHVQPETHVPPLVEQELPSEGGEIPALYLDVGRLLHGVVVDAATARGLAGSRVRLERWGHTGILPAQWLETDSHGRFVLPGYDGAGAWASAYRDGFVPGSESDVVAVRGWPAADVQVLLARGGTITGRVRGPRGHAVAEAVVQLILPEGMAEGSTTTRKDGTFTLKGVPFHQAMRVVASGQEPGYAVSDTLRLTDLAAVQRVDLHLSGRTGLRGTVVDELGLGLPGVRVVVETVEEAPLIVARTATDARGGFAVGGLRTSSVRVIAGLAGRVSASTRTVTSGGVFPEVRLKLLKTPGVTGTVYYPGYRPASGVVVHARPEEKGAPTGWGYSDLDGRFEIAGMGPGVHVLEAVASGGEKASMRIRAPAGHVSLVLRPVQKEENERH